MCCGNVLSMVFVMFLEKLQELLIVTSLNNQKTSYICH